MMGRALKEAWHGPGAWAVRSHEFAQAGDGSAEQCQSPAGSFRAAPFERGSESKEARATAEARRRRGFGGMASMGEALTKACLFGQAREVRRLLSGGTDVNDVNEQGATPLMAASANGNVEVVDMLLAAEANANAADDDGHTPLYYASFKGSLSFWCWLPCG